MLPSCVTTVNTNAFVPGFGLPLVDTMIAAASLGKFLWSSLFTVAIFSVTSRCLRMHAGPFSGYVHSRVCQHIINSWNYRCSYYADRRSHLAVLLESSICGMVILSPRMG